MSGRNNWLMRIAEGANETINIPNTVGFETGKLLINGVAVAAGASITDVTASAAEINLIDGSIAGTSVASKALALGASKNTDILGLPVGGLKIGAAGAEVAITATAAEINKLASSGAVVASGTQNANLVALKANYVKTDIDDAGTIDGTELAVVLNLLAARINALDVCLEAFSINASA